MEVLECGIDEEGNPIFIDEANPRKPYFCVDCGSLLIVKNQGMIRKHHFAHKNIEEHIGGESPIHSNMKGLIFSILKSKLENESDIVLWMYCSEKCSFFKQCLSKKPYSFAPYEIYPNDQHKKPIYPSPDGLEYHFLENIDSVEIEKTDSSGFRPDISLLKNGELIRAVEIVHTHQDSNEKVRYYNKKGIDVIRFHIRDYASYRKFVNEWNTKCRLQYYHIYLNTPCLLFRTNSKELLLQNSKARTTLPKIKTEVENAKNYRCEEYNIGEVYKAIISDLTKKFSKECPYDLKIAIILINSVNVNAHKSLWNQKLIFSGDSDKKRILDKLLDSEVIIWRPATGYELNPDTQLFLDFISSEYYVTMYRD